MTDALRLAVRWAIWIAMDPGREAQWNCDSCVRVPNLQKTRLCGEKPVGECKLHGKFSEDEAEYDDEKLFRYICPVCKGKLTWTFSLSLGTKYQAHSCPIRMLDPTALFLVRLVNWSESIGVLPAQGGLLDQTNFYFEIRSFVVNERAAAEEEMRPKDKGSPQPPRTSMPSIPRKKTLR